MATTTETKWTMAQLKHDLPDVKVLVQGKEFTGHVTGRINPRATVSVAFPAPWDDKQTVEHLWSFDWKDIKATLNTGLPLKV